MTTAVRILYLEDSIQDLELTLATLEQSGIDCSVRHVETRETFASALADESYDVILSDFRLPDFDGLSALRMVRASGRLVPFILVSGTIGEEAAIEALTAGATDYVLKHRLSRLPACVQRALSEMADRRERMLAERALKESEERYRSLIETIKDWVWASDLDGRILFSNQAAERITGFRPSELVGRNVLEFLDPSETDGREPSWFGPAEDSGTDSRPIRWRHRDGTVRHLETSAVPTLNAAGVRDGYRGVARDVTERVVLEAQLRQSQKMEAVGTLAGGIAHDFNNALTTIIGFSELLSDRLGPAESGEELDAIMKAAQHSAALTRQLLAFSRRQVLDPTVLDLREVIRELEKMLRRVIGENIHLTVQSDADLARVKADRGQIEQVLMNLSVNARDAMAAGGSLTIDTRNVALDDGFVLAHPDVTPGPYVMLRVSDTGQGMSAAVLSRMFEPFFTTKPKGRGTGLGLSMVYGIVKQSGGHIDAFSEPGRGTTFRIYLPVAAAEQPNAVAAPGLDRLHGSETVLLAEDEEPVRMLTQRILEQYGYQVISTRSAEEALELAAGLGESIDLILTDAVLPNISGPELARRLEKQLPNLRVLFISGYSDGGAAGQGLLSERDVILQKPFGAIALLQNVRRLLDAPLS
jgi:PAS domain S-box-containing protein